MKGKLIYKETQTFRYTWSWWLIVALLVGIVTIQIVEVGFEFEEGILVAMIILGLILAVLSWLTLTIEIDHSSIYYRFPPIVNRKKRIDKKAIKEVTVRKANTFLEFGGWGYRIGFGKSKALNIAGNWGTQIVLQDGDKLFLGSQNPEELKTAIQKFQERNEEE